MSRPIVLGLGGTVDYEIEWDAMVLSRLADEHGLTLAELDSSVPIESVRDLLRVILGFVASDAGGERFVSSSGIVEEFAAHFATRITLGGTGVRAAYAMQALGVPAVLHLVSIDDHVRRLLPTGSTYVSSAQHDTTDPHLIVQYPADATISIGGTAVTARHPNRIILANDPPNRELVLADDLGVALTGASVFLISGFNSMQDEDALARRLEDLARHMTALPDDALVFYEDAGFHVPALAARVRAALRDRIDVYSLNEDELQGFLGRSVDLLDADEVARALEDAAELTPRVLVVHTKHWAVAAGPGAPDFSAALRGAVTMAATRYRHGDGFTRAEYEATAGLPVSAAGARLIAALERRDPTLIGVPAYSPEVARATTIGLGDSFVGGFIAAYVGDH